jgi:hypothetical protein
MSSCDMVHNSRAPAHHCVCPVSYIYGALFARERFRGLQSHQHPDMGTFFLTPHYLRQFWKNTSMRATLVCPDPGGLVSFEMEGDATSVSRNWKTSLTVKCPHCGDNHAVAFKEVYVDGILTGFRDDFDRLLLGVANYLALMMNRKCIDADRRTP